MSRKNQATKMPSLQFLHKHCRVCSDGFISCLELSANGLVSENETQMQSTEPNFVGHIFAVDRNALQNCIFTVFDIRHGADAHAPERMHAQGFRLQGAVPLRLQGDFKGDGKIQEYKQKKEKNNRNA